MFVCSNFPAENEFVAVTVAGTAGATLDVHRTHLARKAKAAAAEAKQERYRPFPYDVDTGHASDAGGDAGSVSSSVQTAGALATALELRDVARSSERTNGLSVPLWLSDMVLALWSLAIMLLGLRINREKFLEAIHGVTGVSAKTQRLILKTYLRDSTLYESATTRPGRLPEIVFTAAHMSELEQFVVQRLKKGTCTTTAQANKHLNFKFNLAFTKYSVKGMLKELEMEYGTLKNDWTRYHQGARRQAQLRRFVLQYDHALKEEAAGRGVIIYYDESYVDCNGHSRSGYHIPGVHRGFFPKGTGTRIVLMHCMTRDGLVNDVKWTHNVDDVPDAFNMDWPTLQLQNDGGLYSDIKHTCEGTFKLDKTKDYHVTGAIMDLYMRNRVIPTVHKLYPGKHIYFVMDNASTHHARTGEQFNPLNMTKKDIKMKLDALKCERLAWHRDGADGVTDPYEFDLTKGDISGKTSGSVPTAEELQRAAYYWVRTNHPKLLFTDLQLLAMESNMTLLFTVPYAPESQPIENVWGAVKGALARSYDGQVEPHQMVWKIHRAMYRDCDLVRRADNSINPTANAFIRHSRAWIDATMVPQVIGLSVGAQTGTLVLEGQLQADAAAWAADARALYSASFAIERLSVAADSADVQDDEVED